MNHAITGGGSIHVLLQVKNACISDVTVVNHRPLSLPNQLTGLTAENAVQSVSMLYSVCRMAQGLAGCTAIEQAGGVEVAPAQKAARALLLHGETILEHATSALLNWPVLLGKRPSAIAELKTIRTHLAELWRGVYPGGDWCRPGGGHLIPNPVVLTATLDAVEDALRQAGFFLSLEPGGWRASFSEIPGPFAEMLHRLMEKGWERCGASRTAFLNPGDVATLERHIAEIGDAFIAQPEWQGEPAETGALARRHAEPVLQEAIAEYGEGLLAHFLAQCVDTLCSLREMRKLVAELRVDDGIRMNVAEGVGLGVVEAARGVLAHRVEIAEGRVRRYQILAPTEWNFHPRGVFVRGLHGMSGTSMETFAQLMVAAFDPCVSCQIEMRGASRISPSLVLAEDNDRACSAHA